MKSVIGMCLMGSVLLCGARAQGPSKPVLRPGVSVQMAVAEHAVEIRARTNSMSRWWRSRGMARCMSGSSPRRRPRSAI